MDAAGHGLDLIRRQIMLLHQLQHAIRTGVIEVAHGVRFDRHAGCFPLLSQPLQSAVQIPLPLRAEIGVIKPKATFVRRRGAQEAVLGQGGGGNARGGSPTGMDAFGPGALA